MFSGMDKRNLISGIGSDVFSTAYRSGLPLTSPLSNEHRGLYPRGDMSGGGEDYKPRPYSANLRMFVAHLLPRKSSCCET